MIDRQNFLGKPVRNDMINYDNTTYDYATVCLLDYPNFKEHYKLIPIDVS